MARTDNGPTKRGIPRYAEVTAGVLTSLLGNQRGLTYEELQAVMPVPLYTMRRTLKAFEELAVLERTQGFGEPVRFRLINERLRRMR